MGRLFNATVRLPALVLALLLCLSLAACLGKDEETEVPSESEASEEELAEYPVTVEGVTVRARPARVVSLSPALTEKLHDLGLEEVLVGVSDFCDYPASVTGLPACGTPLLPDVEAIADLAPHAVLVQTEPSAEDMAALRELEIDVVRIPPAADIEGFLESYVSLARLLEGEYAGAAMGEKFTRNLRDRLDYLESYLVPYAENHGVKNALYLRLLDFNVATGDTLEHELMSLIGLGNIAAEQTGWLYPEELAKGDGRADFESVEVIFMDERAVTIKMLEQSPYYKGLQATLKDWYLYIDCLVFERQGLRMLDILEDMAAYAYPEATPPVPFEAGGDLDETGDPEEADGAEADPDGGGADGA